MKEKMILTSRIFQLNERAIHSESVQLYSIVRRKFNVSFVPDILRFTHNTAHKILTILFLALILPSVANAHRGARGEVDTCRISVGSEVIHFSAYTPTLTGGKSYCHIIPEIGLTDLVIDYEGKKLRHTTVEFEVTKEPEGSRVYYHNPEKITKGSIDAKVDFAKYGTGNYLLHVTVLNEGETIDSHLPFSVGLEPVESAVPNKILIPFIIIIIIFAGMFFMSKSNKKQTPSA